MTTTASLKQLIAEAALSAADLSELDGWLHGLIEELAAPARTGREVIEHRQEPSVCLQLERVRCGKPSCRCAHGEGHGPYWYAYWSEGGRTRSRYLGKRPPADPAAALPPRGGDEREAPRSS